MSTNLMWKPKGDGDCLSKDLRRVICKKYGDGEVTLDCSDIDYLEGLDHAGIEDADVLIEAINDHTEIIIWQE